MPNTIRRVVTGNDETGTAVISSDSRVASHPGKRGDVHVTDLWMTDPLGSIPVLPVPKGATFRVMEIGPHTAPHMHYTGTLDYIIVLEGVLEMALGDGSKVTMKAGDFMVQRGTVHGWINPTDQPTRFATVILDAGGGFFEA